MSGPSDPSLDIAEDEGEEEEEIELTNEEKIAQLKDQLANGEMGPAVFDAQYQVVWMKIKGQGQSIEEIRAARKSVAPKAGLGYGGDDE